MDERNGCTSGTLHELLTALKSRAGEQELAQVRHAYEVAEAAHHDQVRRSGEPYITHPLAVAGILTELKLDADTIAAALLHDVVEDTLITLDDIRERFGDEVALMVDGVTKLSQREGIKAVVTPDGRTSDTETDSATFQYRTDREAESLRKMMLSVVNDVRVVIIKLADRLHNMRTLSAMKPEKQRRIARETLDIYAPLANRLGIWEWKQELEDLGLRYAEPEAYAHLSAMLAMGARERDAAVQRYIEAVREALDENGIANVEITGRAKQIYSLWRKMQRKGATFDQIRDTQAIRVIIEDEEESAEGAEGAAGVYGVNGADPQIGVAGAISVNGSTGVNGHGTSDTTQTGIATVPSDTHATPSSVHTSDTPTPTIRERKLAAKQRLMGDPGVQACYMALGIVHRLWPPIPGEFDDYIAVPKDNHYQSLHTAVQTKSGMLEVQIRTRSMHRSAEFGVAAHWLYKDAANLDDNYQKQIESLRSAIKSIGNETEDATSFVDALKTDQFKELVFAFTPKGKVVELPVSATVLDFAYRIHSDIGDRCRGGRVNGAMQPVSYQVRNGDVVEILTRKEPMPSRDWLHGNTYCVTANAKHKIRAFFRKQDRDQNIVAGRDIIEREIKRMGVSSWMKLDDIFRMFKVEDGKEDDFLERIGFGNISSVSISSRIMEEDRRREQERSERLSALGGLVDLLRPRTTPQHVNGTGGKKGQFLVAGVPGLQVEVAQCCKPVPGDPVVGYVTRGQGIRVHHRECKNIHNAEQERLIDVVYEGASQDTFAVQLLVIAAERTGLLGELATALGEQKINIIDCQIAKRDLKHGEVQVWIKVEVGHIGDISTAMSRLKSVRNVFDVERVTNGRR